MSNKLTLQIINLFHLFKQLLLAVVLALQPLFSENLAAGNSLAEGSRVDKAIFEDARMGSHTGGVICIVFLAEVSKFVRDVEVIELVSKWK